MKGVHDFIVKVDKEYTDSFETESGLVLYADKRFSPEKLATRVVEVLELPMIYSGIISKGFQVFIDHSVFLRETYQRHGTVENIYTIDAEKGLYKIPESLIYMYRQSENSDWKGYNDNLLVEEIKKERGEKKIGSIFIPESKPERVLYRVVYGNDELEDLDVKIGSSVIIDERMKMPVPMNNKTSYLLRTKDVFAIYG